MVRRRFMLWVLLIVVGFNSIIGMPMHEAMHVENEHVDIASDVDAGTENASRIFEIDDKCTSCQAYAQLSQAFIPAPLERPPHGKLTFIAVTPHDEPFFNLWHSYPSGLDPPLQSPEAAVLARSTVFIRVAV